MKKVFVSELKLMYPIKKMMALIGECSLIAMGFGAILIIVNGEFSFYGVGGRIFEYIFDAGMVIAPIACFKPTIRYLKPFYRCLPILSQRKIRREIVDIIEQEEFSRIESLKENEWLYPRILISERFFRIRNHYIPRHGIVTMWIVRTELGGGKTLYKLWVTLLTGESFCIEIVSVYYQGKKTKPWNSEEATFHMLIHALEANTDGVGFMVPEDSKKKFLKYAVDIKKWAAPYMDHIDKYALIKLFTEENSLQKKLVEDLVNQQEKLPLEERFLLYTDWYMFHLTMSNQIKEEECETPVDSGKKRHKKKR